MLTHAGADASDAATHRATASTSIFAVFSILLWLTVRTVIPWLRDAFGVLPIIGWYLSGTTFVLVPSLLYGCAMAWRELPTHGPSALKNRLRLNLMDRDDVLWLIGGLFAITTASAVILALARYINPNFCPSPWFLQHTPGLHAWVFAAWIPLFVSNILGEELCWRGYVLPRQEARFGRAAWLPNGVLWCLFHWSLGWPIMVILLPITLLLPWIVQRRRKHLAQDHHSCHLQCSWVYHRRERSWRLAAVPWRLPRPVGRHDR
jgi:membrane protease YdiL (CAAX protease family)